MKGNNVFRQRSNKFAQGANKLSVQSLSTLYEGKNLSLLYCPTHINVVSYYIEY